MINRAPIQIDMQPDGSFVSPPRLTFLQRAMRVLLLVVGLGTVVAVGFLLVGIALLLIPAVLAAGLIAWVMWRVQLWRAGWSRGGPIGRFRDR